MPTLVFLHEGLGSIAQWRDFPEALVARTGLPALLCDRLGHGGSDPLDAPRGARYLHREALEVLPEVLERCGVEDAILVGHSDGGSIALLYAAAHPQRVCGAITEAAHVFAFIFESAIITAIKLIDSGKNMLRYQDGQSPCRL